MPKVLFIDYERCIGCKSCVAACAELPSHRGKSRNYVVPLAPGVSTQTIPMTCFHCKDPACARSCPAGAISITDLGTVLSADEEKCVGCRNCTLACPFGIPKFDFAENIMYKCDLCHERTSQGSAPMCASVCPAQTIQWIELDEAMARRRAKIAAKIVGDIPVWGEDEVETRIVTMGSFGGTGVKEETHHD